MKKYLLLLASACMLFTYSCSDDDKVYIDEPKQEEPKADIAKGFFLLNEGDWHQNNASLSHYDLLGNKFTVNKYEEANQVPVMGDTGNDLQIYGNKLYALINTEGEVDVMDVNTAKSIKKVAIPHCRYIAFNNNMAYITSHELEADGFTHKNGFVYEVDTTSLQVIRKVEVKKSPEQLVVKEGKLYVANSGAGFEKELSVIDLSTFTVEENIEVANNINKLAKDKYGNIYVGTWDTSWSPVDPQSAKFLVIKNGTKIPTLIEEDLTVNRMQVVGDSLFILSAPYGAVAQYKIYNTKEQKMQTASFLTDASSELKPYGLGIDDINKRMYIADERGKVVCFDYDGTKQWEETTGVRPAHFAFHILKSETK